MLLYTNLGIVLAADNSQDAISILLTWGPGGLLVALILLGFLEPKRVRETLEQERNDWKMAFEKEQEAHQRTREALAAAEQRAEIAVDAARTTNQILDEMQGPPRRKATGSRGGS